jgi:peptide/nickel transport system ATP-binding protein
LACRPRLESKYRRLPTVDDFMQAVEKDGQVRVIEKQMDAARLKHLAEQGRGRLLHPKSELAAIGHPWQEGHHARDTTCVAEGTSPLLAVDNLQVYFPVKRGILARTVDHVKAVDGINFNVYRGQTLGLVGESGCGKTTTGRAILRLIEPTGGSVRYDGVSLGALDSGALRAMRRKMQIVFQDPYGSLNPRMTIESALTEPMVIQKIGRNARERRGKAAALLKEVGLETRYLRRYPHEFSGGQRQRICIARALAADPEFIVCDESVSSLDVSVQAQVLNLFKDLQDQRGLTYIFISHDLSVVKFMADMMAVMHDGKILEFGPSENIYANPREKYTKRLIDATPRDDIELIKKRVAERGKRTVE